VITTPGLDFQIGRIMPLLLAGWPEHFTNVIFAGDLPNVIFAGNLPPEFRSTFRVWLFKAWGAAYYFQFIREVFFWHGPKYEASPLLLPQNQAT
jgi:hypothetical protein